MPETPGWVRTTSSPKFECINDPYPSTPRPRWWGSGPFTAAGTRASQASLASPFASPSTSRPPTTRCTWVRSRSRWPRWPRWPRWSRWLRWARWDWSRRSSPRIWWLPGKGLDEFLRLRFCNNLWERGRRNTMFQGYPCQDKDHLPSFATQQRKVPARFQDCSGNSGRACSIIFVSPVPGPRDWNPTDSLLGIKWWLEIFSTSRWFSGDWIISRKMTIHWLLMIVTVVSRCLSNRIWSHT